jgi:hypothetical protein
MAAHNIGFKEAKAKYKNYSEALNTEVLASNSHFPQLPLHNRYNVLAFNESDENTEQAPQPSFRRPRPPPQARPPRMATRPSNPHNSANLSQASTSAYRGIVNPYSPNPNNLRQNTNTQSNQQIVQSIAEKIDESLKNNTYNTKFTTDILQQFLNSLIPQDG